MSRRALLRLAATFVVVTAAPAEPAEDSGSRAEYRRAYTEAFDSEQHELAAELAGSRLAELGERGPPLERSAALGDLGWALLERFRWQDARAAFDQARELRANAGAPANREHATLLLGLASATMPDDPDAAEPLFREALHVFRQAGGQDDPDGWWTWKRLADLRAATDAEAAEAMLREAVAGLARTDPAGLRLSTARRALAGQVARRGDSVEAESLRRTTLEDLRSKVHPDHSQIAGLLNGLGEIRHRRGEHAAAEELYLEALERARRRLGDRHPHVFTYLNNVAAVRTAAGRLPESESAFRELVALIGTAKGKEDAQVGSVLGGLGWNLVQQGRYAEADSVLAHALEVRRRATSEDDSWVSSIQEYRVRVAYFQGEYGRAEERLGELLERYRRKSGNTNRRVQSALEGLGVMAASRADFQGAVNYLEESARLFETLRLRSARGAGRATFAGSPYERLAALHLELGSGERAWEAAERLRGLTLADLLLAASERPLTPEEEAREDELAAELSRRESSMEAARAEFVTAGDDEGRMLYETEFGELLAAEAKWFAFQEEIVARYPVREGRTFPLARVQAALAPDEAVVGWVDAGITRQRPVSWAYVLRSAGPVHWEPLENALQSGRGHATRSPTVAAFREELRAPARRLLPTPADAVLGAARGVWKERLGPLEPHLDGVSALVIVPSRIMTGVPVEALPDAEDVLVGDRYSVTYAPSATIHAWLRESASPTPDLATALLVGDVPFRSDHLAPPPSDRVPTQWAALEPSLLRSALDGDRESISELPRLTGSRREVETVAGWFRDAEVLLGPDASEPALIARLTGDSPSVLHVATHALVDPDNADGAALVLAQVDTNGDPIPPDRGDGLINVREIVRSWDLDSELVVLSACRSADGHQTWDGTYGLTSAFLQAGARSVLASLWEVDDEASALLMERFYQEWLGASRPMPRGEALGTAKRWLRSYESPDGRHPWAHPFYWSAFVLVGDGR